MVTATVISTRGDREVSLVSLVLQRNSRCLWNPDNVSLEACYSNVINIWISSCWCCIALKHTQIDRNSLWLKDTQTSKSGSSPLNEMGGLTGEEDNFYKQMPWQVLGRCQSNSKLQMSAVNLHTNKHNNAVVGASPLPPRQRSKKWFSGNHTYTVHVCTDTPEKRLQ